MTISIFKYFYAHKLSKHKDDKLAQEQIDEILLHVTDESDLEEENDGWEELSIVKNVGNFYSRKQLSECS